MKTTMLPVAAYGGIIFTFYAIAFVTTVLRLYTRVLVTRSVVGFDDHLIAVGTLATFAVAMLSYYAILSYIRIYEASRGADEMDTFSSPWIFLQWDLGYRYDGLAEIVYVLALPCAKCSILAFYCRVKSMSGSCVMLFVLMGAIAAHGVANFAFTMAAYDPLPALWNMFAFAKAHPDRFRWRYEPTMIQLVNTCFQLVFDLIILAIPLPFLLRMKLRRGKKVALLVVYSLSLASFAVTAVRLAQCVDFRVIEHSASLDPFEAFIARVFYLFWTSMEVATVIIVANLPALYALWRRARGRADDTGTPAYFMFSDAAHAFGAHGAPAGGEEVGLSSELERRFDESIAKLGPEAKVPSVSVGTGSSVHSASARNQVS